MKNKLYAITKDRKYRILEYYDDFFARWSYKLEQRIDFLGIIEFWIFKSDDSFCDSYYKWVKDYDMRIINGE